MFSILKCAWRPNFTFFGNFLLFLSDFWKSLFLSTFLLFFLLLKTGIFKNPSSMRFLALISPPDAASKSFHLFLWFPEMSCTVRVQVHRPGTGESCTVRVKVHGPCTWVMVGYVVHGRVRCLSSVHACTVRVQDGARTVHRAPGSSFLLVFTNFLQNLNQNDSSTKSNKYAVK